MNKHRHNYKSNTSFIDLFMLLTMCFSIMVIILMLYLKPIIPTKEDIPLDEQIIVKMKWDDHSNDDLDMWMLAPDGTIIGFRNKDQNGITLERDDLGHTNEFGYVNGVMETIFDNTEVIRVKQVMDGDYYVSVHFYAGRDWVRDKMKGNPPLAREFTVWVYVANKHVPISVSTQTVRLQEEVGVVKLTFFNNRLVDAQPSTRQIALAKLRETGDGHTSSTQYPSRSSFDPARP